jgi:hypothetical protein
MRWLLAVVLLFAGFGCRKPEPAPPPQARLIGMSKPALLACAGAPAQTSSKDDGEYLTYVAGERPPPSEPPRQSGMTPMAGTSKPGYCRVTFALRRSIVESVTFAGPSASDLVANPDCLRLINKCLAVR